jgi:hypothetical protein
MLVRLLCDREFRTVTACSEEPRWIQSSTSAKASEAAGGALHTSLHVLLLWTALKHHVGPYFTNLMQLCPYIKILTLTLC